MKIRLRNIPGFEPNPSDEWEVKTLEINDSSPVLSELLQWKRSENANYKKIIKAMEFAAKQHRVHDKKKVKPCANKKYDGTYEFRAHQGDARVMFFYDESEESIIVCTTPFFGKGGSSKRQDTAFKNCYDLKTLYLAQKNENRIRNS